MPTYGTGGGALPVGPGHDNLLLYTHQESLAAPSLDSEGRPQDGWQPSVTENAWGNFHVIINGVDVTWFRGVRTQIESYTLQDPFGCGPATLHFPQLKPWDDLNSGSTSAWTQIGADVDIVKVGADGSSTTLWSGQLATYRTSFGESIGITIDCIGDLWASDLQHVHQAPYLPPTDVGKVIADTLNNAVSRRHNRSSPFATATTGVLINRRAAQAQGVVEYVQELLATFGVLSSGTDQWTVGRVAGSPRNYEMRLRSAVGSTWTIRPGGRWGGTLVADGTSIPNVIYASGVNDSGGAWAGWLYPGGAGALNNAYRVPLAYDERARPRLWDSTTGKDLGANPLYDATVLRVEADQQLGAGISKAEGYISTRAGRALTPSVGWAGTLTLEIDPAEGSRFDIKEGDAVVLQDFEGIGVTVHVSQVKVTPPYGDSGGSVELTVDQFKRDLITVAGALAADEEAKSDPARMPARKNRASLLRSDRTVPFDSESRAGVIPLDPAVPFAVSSKTWTFVDVPVSQVGKVAVVDIQTSPARAFCVAFFGDLAVTSTQMKTLVGDPLHDPGSGYSPFDVNATALDTLGLIQAIGGPYQAAGYSRLGGFGDGYESSPLTGTSTTLTGRLYATGTWSYTSTKPPYLRLFFWTVGATTITGRIVPAPLEL